MRNASALVLLIGQSPFSAAREAIFRDLSKTPFPRSVDSLIQDCEKEQGWRQCLPIAFPGNILMLPVEQRTALVETEARALAERLVATHQGREPQKPTLHPSSLAVLIADEELRRRCGDVLGAENDYDRVIAQACLVLEDHVRRAIGADPSLYGKDLMGHAFSPRDGLLRLGGIENEQQGIMFIYQGLMAFFRNTTGHHSVTTYTKHDAFCFAMWVGK